MNNINEIDCLVCLDEPNKAVVLLDGDIPVCQDCLNYLIPNLSTNGVNTVEVI